MSQQIPALTPQHIHPLIPVDADLATQTHPAGWAWTRMSQTWASALSASPAIPDPQGAGLDGAAVGQEGSWEG